MIPWPKLTVVEPDRKFVPVNPTLNVWNCCPCTGAMADSVGTGLFPTMKPFGTTVAPPPGGRLATVTSLGPGTMAESIRSVAVSCEKLFTVTELEMCASDTTTTVTPLMKPAPVIITGSVSPAWPLVGEIEATVGEGFTTEIVSETPCSSPPVRRAVMVNLPADANATGHSTSSPAVKETVVPPPVTSEPEGPTSTVPAKVVTTLPMLSRAVILNLNAIRATCVPSEPPLVDASVKWWTDPEPLLIWKIPGTAPCTRALSA